MEQRFYYINGVYYDMKTKNKSFLKYAIHLKKAGVENWYFCLAIYDPEVAFIDVYKEDKEGNSTLTQQEVLRIETECYRNMWYYIREVARIPGPGKHGIPYAANLGNMAQAYLFSMGIDNWLNLPRQCGKTQGAVTLIKYSYDYGGNNLQFYHIGRDLDLVKTNLARFADQRDILPLPLQHKTFVNADGKIEKGQDSATIKENPITKNRITIKGSVRNRDDAVKVGRGFSISIAWSDETEFTKFIDVIVSNMAPAYRTSAENAEKANMLHARLFTSTPGDMDSDEGKQSSNVLKNTIPFNMKMYDMTKEELKEFVHKSKKNSNHIVYIEYPYYMLDKDEEWLANQYAEINDPLVFRREVLLQRLHGSSLSPFSQEQIQDLNDCVKTPIDQIILKEFYVLDIYEILDRKIPYIVGIDCATGTGSDSNAMTIIHPKTLRPVAEFNCPYIGEIEFGDLIEELVQKYIPRACLIPERNNGGDNLIEYLLTKTSIGGNIYYDKTRDIINGKLDRMSTIEVKLKAKAEMRKYYGMYTEGKNRAGMIALLTNRMRTNRSDFVTKGITHDISVLIRFSTGKIAAMPGEHDDNIMSYLIGMYTALYGNNLPRFGIYIEDSYSNGEESNEYKPDMSILRSILPKEVADNIEKEYFGETSSYIDPRYPGIDPRVIQGNIDDFSLDSEGDRAAIIRAEREGSYLASKGLIKGENYYKPGHGKDYFDEYEHREDYSLFDDLNQLD